MACSPSRSLWRSNDAASTATFNLNAVFIISRPREKRRRSLTLCLHNSTSNSPSSSDVGRLVDKIPKKKGVLADGSLSIAERIVPCKVNLVKRVDKENGTKELGTETKLVGKKKMPYGGRMVFVSNKLKSIILLNLITVVYGMF